MGTVRHYDNADGTRTYRVQWRTPRGDQRSTSFSAKLFLPADYPLLQPERRERARVTAGRKAERAAHAHNAAVETDKRRGQYRDLSRGKVTFGEWFSIYMAEAGPPKEQSRARYRRWAEMHVLPEFGHRPLNTIERDDVIRWATERKAAGVGTRTLFNVATVLKASLSYAVEAGRLDASPATNLHRMRNGKPGPVPRPKSDPDRIRFMDAGEIAALTEAVDARYSCWVIVQGVCGLRLGEACALHVKDLDEKASTLSVRKQISDIRRGEDRTTSLVDNGLFASSATVLFPQYVYDAPVQSADDEGVPGLFDGAAATTEGRHHNVTDQALASYRNLDPAIGRDDVFFYVYGVLHSPDYRTAFAADLRKSLPRIPQVASGQVFWAFSKAGRKLAHLHTEYESVEPCPDLTYAKADGFDPKHPDAFRVLKMKHPKIADLPDQKGARVDDRSRIIYNDWITIGSIPERAYGYELGSRSAIAWVMESNRVRTDKASGIRNDPNDWAIEHRDPAYVLNLVGRVVTVSMRTLDLVDSLPRLDL